MPRAAEETYREIRRTLVWIAATALIFLFVWYAWELLFLAFAGLLLAIILRAMADWMECHTRLGPRLSFTAVVCGLAVLAALTAWFIVPRIISQTAQILHIIPGSLEQAKASLDRFGWGRQVVRFVRRAMMHVDFGPKLTHLIGGMLDAIAAAVIVAVVGLYAAANPKGYFDGLLHLVPERHREQTRQVRRKWYTRFAGGYWANWFRWWCSVWPA